METIRLVKGHGTENDFLLIADPAGEMEIDPSEVRRLADRHAGIGADGVIVARPSRLAPYDSQGDWFMDYRNADGSLAEMCGNGARVFAAFLRHEGLVGADDWPIVVATRGGDRTIWADGETYTVDMGDYALPGGQEALAAGYDVAVGIPGLGARPGLRVTMPNPHTVVALTDEDELAGLSLTHATYDPPPADGTNLELVVAGSLAGDRGSLRMRVLERGVGETRSCGTGCCAAAIAVRAWAGAGAPDIWDVHVPGGTVTVRIEGTRVFLTGPAVLVAEIAAFRQPTTSTR